MSKVRIYKPAKNAMQSGLRNSGGKSEIWLLEYMPTTPYFVEGLMGWNGMSDTMRELRLKFPSKEAAVAYASKNKLEFEVCEAESRKERTKPYADNFAFGRVRA